MLGRSTRQALGVALIVALGASLGSLDRPPPALAAFPGSTGKIAFQSNRDGNFEVYAMAADGTRQTRLTHNPGFDGNPAWSLDGTKIAYESERNGNVDIYVMNADGSEPRRLTRHPAFDGGPAWSRDGEKIAFRSNRDGNAEIYVMNADGTGQTRLTHDPADDLKPTWSPDGKRIAFRSDRDGFAQIYVMNADGSGQTRISRAIDLMSPTSNLAEPVATDAFPAWSPDGGRIAFDHNLPDNRDVYVMNPDGTNRRALTNDPAHHGGPAWSHDGRMIAFRSSRDGNPEIYVIDAQGGPMIRLTNNSWADHRPDWNHRRLAPPNRFTIGRAIRNERRGTARLPIAVPGRGNVTLKRSARVGGFTRHVDRAATVRIPVRPRGRAARILKRAGARERVGRASVRVRVTFEPPGGWPRTQVRRLRLVRAPAR